MAELLLRVRDNVHATDFYKNCALTKRGDVIVAVEDGHVWGLRELDNPDWRILKVPGLSLVRAQSFLLAEKDTDPAHPSRTLRPRVSGLDLDRAGLPADFAAYLADDSRHAGFFTLPAGSGTECILALKRKHSRFSDPDVTGNTAQNVIG